jgi:hypothetical protein
MADLERRLPIRLACALHPWHRAMSSALLASLAFHVSVAQEWLLYTDELLCDNLRLKANILPSQVHQN